MKTAKFYNQVDRALVSSPCKCGCGRIPTGLRRVGGRRREYFSATCRQRALRARVRIKA